MINYLYSLRINLDFILSLYLCIVCLCGFSCLSLLSPLLRVIFLGFWQMIESCIAHVYQFSHPHFWLVYFFVLLLFLFCYGFVLELEMCFFCLVLFFDTFRFTSFEYFFLYILRRNYNFSTKLLIR